MAKKEVFTDNDRVHLHVGDVFSIMTSRDHHAPLFIVVGIRRTTMESEGPQWFEIKYLDKKSASARRQLTSMPRREARRPSHTNEACR